MTGVGGDGGIRTHVRVLP